MRAHYNDILKEHFRTKIKSERKENKITQRDMAYRLEMAPRTYFDLERGRTGCGAVTLVIYLIYLCDDPMSFLEGVRCAFEASDSNEP